MHPPVLTFGNVKATHYQATLKNIVEPLYGDKFRDASLIWQQDNAKIHTAKGTQDLIEDLKWQTFKWPACSCDWSPIEFFWCLVAAELDANWRPKNMGQLQRALEYIWPQVTKREVIQKCYDRALHNMVASLDVDCNNTYHRKNITPRRRYW